jgi:O-antigen/teichoic acid export membrane protein
MPTDTPRSVSSAGAWRNVAYLLGARGVYLVSKSAYTIVLARLLGPELYGILNYAISWSVAFLPLGSLGLWAIMSREAGLDRARGIHTAGNALSLRVGLSFAAGSASALIAVFAEAEPSAQRALWIVSLALVGRSLAQYCENVFNAFENSAIVLRQESAFRSLELLLGVAAALFSGRLEHVALSYALVWWLQAAWGLWAIRREVPGLRPSFDRAELGRLLRQGLPLGTSSLFVLLLGTAPMLLFRHVGELGELGQLAVLSQIFAILSLVPTQFAVAALPPLSRAMSEPGETAWDAVSRGLRGSAAVVLVVSLGACAVGPWLIESLLGKAFAASGSNLGLFLLLLLPRSWGTLLWNALLAQGRVWAGALGALAGTLVLGAVLLVTRDTPSLASVMLSMHAGQWIWVAVLLVALRAPRAAFSRWQVVVLPLLVTGGSIGVYAALARLGQLPAALIALGFALAALAGSPMFSREEKQAAKRLLLPRRLRSSQR